MKRTGHPEGCLTLERAFCVLKPSCILLVMPDREVRAQVAQGLRADNHQVLEVGSPEELGVILRQVDQGYIMFRVDLVVLETRKDQTGWLGVLRALRLQQKNLPLVLIRQAGDAAGQQEADRPGVLALFEQGFDLDDLRTVVLNAVSGSPRDSSPSTLALAPGAGR